MSALPQTQEPITNGANGRNRKGQFAKGNKGGPGNPNIHKIVKLKAAIVRCTTEEDVKCLIRKLVEKGANGDVAAIHELFDRLFGKAKEAIELTGKDGGPLSHKDVTFDHDDFRNRFAAYLTGRLPARLGDGVAAADSN